LVPAIWFQPSILECSFVHKISEGLAVERMEPEAQDDSALRFDRENLQCAVL
jgi:hypothetical protein